MKIFFTDQSGKFDHHLNDLAGCRVMTYHKEGLKEKTSTIALDTAKRLEDLDLDFFFNYKIFPSAIMTYKTQWEAARRKMKVGDTIVQQAFIPPFPRFSQKIIFGVRINAIIDEETRKGFSYETLEGHVERGVSTFTIEQQTTGTLFRIHTFSEPGNLLSKLAGSFFSLPYQSYCTGRALLHVKKQIV